MTLYYILLIFINANILISFQYLSTTINYHEVNRWFCQVFPDFITFLSYVMAQKVMYEFDYPVCQPVNSFTNISMLIHCRICLFCARKVILCRNNVTNCLLIRKICLLLSAKQDYTTKITRHIPNTQRITSFVLLVS